jgi:DNA-binding transcriptional ArsR family regulator
MRLGSWNRNEMEKLSRIYQGVSHPARIAVLVAIDSELNLNKASNFLEIKRPSLQDHVAKLVDAELVYRPRDGATYQLTPMGEYFMDRLVKEREYIIEALQLLDEAAIELRESKEPDRKELEEYDIPIDKKELNRQIHTQKWEDLDDEIKELLDG